MRCEAPVGSIFRSVEGECSRVGEVTSFVHVADGIVRTPQWAVAQALTLGDSVRWVLDTCEASYWDWEPFALEFAKQCQRPLVLETRGERHIARDDNPHREGFGLYLHLTPGLTVLGPDDLLPGDEVKLLIHRADQVRDALSLLTPFADAGLRSYVLPRLGSELAPTAECFEKFLAYGATPVRMMPVIHEVIGID